MVKRLEPHYERLSGMDRLPYHKRAQFAAVRLLLSEPNAGPQATPEETPDEPFLTSMRRLPRAFGTGSSVRDARGQK